MKTTAASRPAASAAQSQDRVRILHLEDSPEDAELIQHTMRSQGLDCQVTHVEHQAEFQAFLDQPGFDLILCDHGIPGYDGFAALKLARAKRPDLPIIMVSGTLDDAQAVESLKGGATDYILKQRLPRLVPAIRRALQEAEERRKQAAAEERIREQANLLNLTRDAIAVRTMDDQIIFWNNGAEQLFGWTQDEAIGRLFGKWLKGDEALLNAARTRLLEAGDWQGELKLSAKGDSERIVFSRWNLVRDKDGQPQAILSVNTDITEKKKIEAIYLRAQRMDSIGALAGGIAHDLNNALAPVMMSAELLKICPDQAARERFLETITSSVQRATGMVKQILSFARGSGGQSGPITLQRLIREMVKIVADTFPKSISIESKIDGKDLWKIQGDATELHQVLLNLCVNARDAMLPEGGQLTISAENVTLDEGLAEELHGVPGPYVRLVVADTGAGIPPEVLPRIFEPFFTTKGPEKGTGLGLSTVASIIKHHNGLIDIKTEADRGTEFRIFLPAIQAPEESEAPASEAVIATGHGELILVIDDEEAVRELTKTTLESYGYKVVTAQNGLQGLARFEELKDQIRLVISDTDMPFMDGMTAMKSIKKMKPDLPIIVASGSKRDAEALKSATAVGLTNLAKPFSLDQLLIAVEMVLKH